MIGLTRSKIPSSICSLSNAMISSMNLGGLAIIFWAFGHPRFFFSDLSSNSTALVTSRTAGGGFGRALSSWIDVLSKQSTAALARSIAGLASSSSFSACALSSLALVESAKAISSSPEASAISLSATAFAAVTCVMSFAVSSCFSLTSSILTSRSFFKFSTFPCVCDKISRPVLSLSIDLSRADLLILSKLLKKSISSKKDFGVV
mmetsp:Transcript_2303/g.2143  ORF Transcript_2303/g.2143 Transcript_2303/m.2143 type:complete len:205 (-) Transcript_2303:613-1227(-)